MKKILMTLLALLLFTGASFADGYMTQKIEIGQSGVSMKANAQGANAAINQAQNQVQSAQKEVKKTKVKKSKKEETSQIQNIKDTLTSILEKSYNIKTRAWREEVKETTLIRIKISTECTNDKYTNEYTILMYVRDLAKKSNYAVYDFGMYEKGYHFELIGPIENLEL